VSVLCIDLFVLGSDIDLEVAVCLPFALQKLDLLHFLPENGVTDHYSKETVAYVLVLFVEVHKCPKEDGEVNDVCK